MDNRTLERRGFLLALAGAGVALTTLGTGAVQAATLAAAPAPATGLDDIRAALTPLAPEEMQRRRHHRRGPPHRFVPPPRRPRVRCWINRWGQRVCRRVW